MFRGLKGLAAFVVFFAIVCAVVVFDVFGLDTVLPSAASLDSMVFTINGHVITFTDEEKMTYLLDTLNTYPASAYGQSESFYGEVAIDYDVYGGKEMENTYTVYVCMNPSFGMTNARVYRMRYEEYGDLFKAISASEEFIASHAAYFHTSAPQVKR